MTPEDLDNALKSLDIIRTKKYQHRDEISLILEARTYIKGRLPVRDRATAVAILLQRDAVLRDAVLIESPERGHQFSGRVVVSHCGFASRFTIDESNRFSRHEAWCWRDSGMNSPSCGSDQRPLASNAALRVIPYAHTALA